MNPDPADAALDALFGAARAEARDYSRVAFAFETRVMARVREERNTSVFAWAWKLAPFFAAIVVALGLWDRATAAHLGSTASLMAEAVRQHPERLIMSLVERGSE